MPAFLFSGIFWVAGSAFHFFSPIVLGELYFTLAPILHLIQYEFRFKNEYPFFINLGFPKRQLWVYGLFCNLAIFILLVILEILCH